MATDLTAECRAGFDAPAGSPSPHIDTSPADDAFRIGAWLASTGRTRPSTCSRSRGSRYRVNDMVVTATWARPARGAAPAWVAERVA